MKSIKVLIVDDQKSVRDILKAMLVDDNQIIVVGEAADPYEAREKIKALEPHVLTLDVEMPKMDGITFLKNLMRLKPMPVVMLSTLTQRGADITLEALDIGAVDYIAKPKMDDILANQAMFKFNLINKIKAAAEVNKTFYQASNLIKPVVDKTTLTLKGKLKDNHIIAIGASTGGIEAIRQVISQLPENGPAIVVTQHIPEAFSSSFANRLNNACAMTVHEAWHGQKVSPGNVYIAPGHSHLTVVSKGKQYFCNIVDSEPVNRHKPSVSVLFDSIASLDVTNCQLVLLTGMGHDGADAMLRLKQRGAFTIAQDKNSSLVWGMPGSAVALDAACVQLPLNEIAQTLLKNATQ